MKLVITKFKSGGLHKKHVVATWNVGNHLSICCVCVCVCIYTVGISQGTVVCPSRVPEKVGILQNDIPITKPELYASKTAKGS